MSERFKSLLKHLSIIVESIPPDAVEQLAKALAGSHDEKLQGRLGSLAATSGSKSLYQELDKIWSQTPDLSSSTLSIAIQSALWTYKHSVDAQKISIIWTGPTTEAVPFRRTEQALRELIDGTKSELIIVSFIAYKVQDIVEAIQRAINERDVNVKIILEIAEEIGGKLSFDSIGQMRNAVKGANLYYWPIDQRQKNDVGNHGSLHAKCAVADSETAFISSANLTGYALELNMEMGIVVNGGNVPKRIFQHFKGLIDRKIIVEAHYE